jgi:outer membrane protein assembly factor BamA
MFEGKRDLFDLARSIYGKELPTTEPKQLTKKIQISLLPSVSGVPDGKGFAFVTAFNAAFLFGEPQTTNLSNVYFTPYFTLYGKLVLPIRSYIWTKDNKWNFIGDYRYMIYPDKTYGLGSGTIQDNGSEIDYNYVRFHQSILRNVYSFFVLGGGIKYDYHYQIAENWTQTGVSDFQKYGQQNQTTSSGFSLEAAFDSRLNSVNPSQGIYAGVTYRINPTWLGSSQNWQSVYADFKTYYSFHEKQKKLIGFWAFYWDVVNGNAPYLDLPSTAWDPNYRSGRGYYQSRFRGDAMAYSEAEYRFDIAKSGLWGGTVYANVQSLRNPFTHQFEKIAPGAGAGLRLKFNKYSDTNLTFDLGVGRESWNWYIGIGEFF